jgi:hypothetical protein
MTSRSGKSYHPRYTDRECDELLYLTMVKIDALEAKIKELMVSHVGTKGDSATTFETTSSGAKSNGKDVVDRGGSQNPGPLQPENIDHKVFSPWQSH